MTLNEEDGDVKQKIKVIMLYYLLMCITLATTESFLLFSALLIFEPAGLVTPIVAILYDAIAKQ